MSKTLKTPRTPMPPPTRVHEDTRTQRIRARGDAERAEIEAQLAFIDEIFPPDAPRLRQSQQVRYYSRERG